MSGQRIVGLAGRRALAVARPGALAVGDWPWVAVKGAYPRGSARETAERGAGGLSCTLCEDGKRVEDTQDGLARDR